jgi:tyrosine-protein kinase Etk/Wzc
MANEPKLKDYLNRAMAFRKQMGIIIAAGIVLSVIIAFLWPPMYASSTTLLPPSEEETGFNVTSLVRGFSLPGVKIPTRSGPEDIAMSVLKSRRVMSAIVQRFDLIEIYKVKNEAAAIRKLRKRSSFGVDKTGTVFINAHDSDPQRAADMANAFAEELDRFNREIRMTKGRRTREFVGERLKATSKEMVEAEQELKEYQETHSTVVMSPEQTSTLEVGARLFARQAALGVRLGMIRQYASENSEEVLTVRRELDEVNRQIASLPDIGLELARKMRDLRIQETVYGLLSAQYEEARINEVRDIATLEVLDDAVPSDKPYWPRKGILILLGTFLSAAAAAGWAGFQIRRSSASV